LPLTVTTAAHLVLPDTISSMDDFRDLARDPAHRRRFEKLLYLAAQRGAASSNAPPHPADRQRARSCPSAATVRALLDGGADPSLTDETALTALDYARRKLARPARRRRKSPSLDENDQLRLSPAEQAELDDVRRELSDDARDFLRIWWQERLRAARRVFNDPDQVEQIVDMLEAAGGQT
jgi:hypothetical protein